MNDPAGERWAVRGGMLLLWLAIQLAALSISAARLPLSARYPQPAETLALHQLVVVQVLASAALFPLLMSNAATGAAVVATGWPALACAALLASTEPSRAVSAGIYVSGWLATLMVWKLILQSYKSQLIGVALATSVALGGPLLWYLRAEFTAARATIDWRYDGMIGPINGALAQLEQPQFSTGPWLSLAVLLVGGALAVSLRRTLERRVRPR